MGPANLSQLRQVCGNVNAFHRSLLPRRLASSIYVEDEQEVLVRLGRRLSWPIGRLRHEFRSID